MRVLTGFLLLLLAGSCASKEEKVQTVSDQIEVTLDTVMIDAREEFLYLQDQLYSSNLSADKDFLFNFNSQGHKVEKIDLNRLNLEQVIPFETEGPHGLSPRYPHFSILANQNLLFWDYHFYKIFDQNGLLVKDLELDKIADEYLGGTEYYPMSLFEDKTDPNRIVGLIIHWETVRYFFLDFDLEKRTFMKIDLPQLEKNSDYIVQILSEGRPAGGYGGSVYSIQSEDKILLSTKTFNEAHVFDLNTDSLYQKKWDTPLLGYKKAYLPTKSVEYSSGELKEIIRKSDEEISYGSLIWDGKNQRYFRFSYNKHFSESLSEYGNYVSTGAEVYLSIFDKELNLIAEAQIPELTQTPNFHFTKDGNIWIFENIDDELAFVKVEVEVM